MKNWALLMSSENSDSKGGAASSELTLEQMRMDERSCGCVGKRYSNVLVVGEDCEWMHVLMAVM